MAEMQDLDSEVGELEIVEKQLDEVVPELPEKYRGKAVGDIIKMHQEAERLVDRQAQEVGEVRRLADELLRSQLRKQPEVEMPPEIDFFENPQEAIRQAVENNPKVIAAEQYAKNSQREYAKQKLNQLHPDFGSVVQEGEFVDWIKSSKIRTQLFNQAEAYDVDAADELLSTFKSIKAVKQKQVSEVDTTARKQAMNAASVDSGGSGETSKKVYRRADLIQLKLRDPQGYASRQDEIDRAYQEGRIR